MNYSSKMMCKLREHLPLGFAAKLTSTRLAVVRCLVGIAAVGAMPVAHLSAGETDGVCLYDAMEAEQVEVRCIAVNGAKSNISISNLTNEVLSIRLPDALVAVPAARADEDSSEAKLGRRGSSKIECQAVGGSFVSNGRSSRSVGEGNSALLKLAPKKTRKLAATTVGLEFGKAVPNARVEYKLVRPESKLDDPRLMELFRQLGNNQVKPFVGQAIAWHLTDDMSWNELSQDGSNSQTISNYLKSSSYDDCSFCPMTLNAANNWVNQCEQRASTGGGASIVGGKK
jgi:hypothetical protein